MKTIEEIKKEIANEIGEPNGFDFQVEIEAEIGAYERIRQLYSELVERYIEQYKILNGETKENIEYEKGIELYKQGLNNIEEAMDIFENSKYGMPEYLEMYFSERQGNELLWTLQKEASYLKEDMDDINI